MRAHFARHDHSCPAGFDHCWRCSASACPHRASLTLPWNYQSKYLWFKSAKSITWCTGAGWKSRSNLPWFVDEVFSSMQLTHCHWLPWKRSLKTVGNTNQKNRKDDDIEIFLTSSGKWTFYQRAIEPSAQSLGGIKAPVVTAIHTKLSTTCFHITLHHIMCLVKLSTSPL